MVKVHLITYDISNMYPNVYIHSWCSRARILFLVSLSLPKIKRDEVIIKLCDVTVNLRGGKRKISLNHDGSISNSYAVCIW